MASQESGCQTWYSVLSASLEKSEAMWRREDVRGSWRSEETRTTREIMEAQKRPSTIYSNFYICILFIIQCYVSELSLCLIASSCEIFIRAIMFMYIAFSCKCGAFAFGYSLKDTLNE